MIVVGSARAADKLPEPLISGLKNPESVIVGPDGGVYVSIIGEFDKDGDGAVVQIKDGKTIAFATNLNDPKGLAVFQQTMFVADKDTVLKIDKAGKTSVLAGPDAFPTKPKFLNDLVADPESGILYVSDSGDLKGNDGVVYKIDPKGKVTVVTDSKKLPGLKTPNGLLMDGQNHLLLLDFGSGELHRVKIADGSGTKIADGFKGGDGLVWDRWGRLYISSWEQGKVWVIARPGDKPILMAEGFQSAADICLDPTNKLILVPDMKAGTLVALPAQVPGAEVDESPLALVSEPAFANLKWANWDPEGGTGKVVPLRPIVLTHAGDGSNRVFVATQHGVIHVFPNDQKADKTKVFLDIESRVRYNDKQNEEGFLGMAFHPEFKKNGEFFVFYTDKKANLQNVVSRFRVSKDDPNVADPSSEEELLRISHKFWNHDGGTIAFGPDGYLYIAIGDGGLANDPDNNGQNLNTLLGKILRIDVNKKEDGKNYAIPKDNPFVGKADTKPEIYSYGWRNPWRFAFDRKTGKLWTGEVGQNLYEEINIVEKGGNYGWRKRESLHPFGVDGVGPTEGLIDPIWEYHHDVGKSITGGHVYRGDRLPELEGHYIYADYVSGKVWALKYDEAKKRVVANRPIKHNLQPILSFGEDEKGDVYFLTVTSTGKGISRFVKSQ
jgi:glucose/arabinose dehydrogenase